AVAPHLVEMDGVLHAARSGHPDAVARLVRDLQGAKATAAAADHLRHEGKRVEIAALVERFQDLRERAHFHPLARAQAEPVGRLCRAARAHAVVAASLSRYHATV